MAVEGKSKMVRTAVVVVHGMGEQLPVETLNRFTRTAIPVVGGERRYFSRPTRITDSYEARRHIAFRQLDEGGALVHGQADLYEYHWSYMMTGNRLADLAPVLRRMLFRAPWTVPAGLRIVWGLAWVVLAALLVLAGWLLVRNGLDDISLGAVVAAVFGPGLIAGAVLGVLRWLGGAVTATFVDVVRYLDRSPRSYEVRRRIRKGMVDLLKALHEGDRYQRVVVVAHSLGGYIASTRRQGNPWLVTDLVTLGTPMYFADLLYTRDRKDFRELVRRTELPTCPPVSHSKTVEGVRDPATAPAFGRDGNGRDVLADSSPFAVVQWTNLWFPAVWGFFGDWFGGPLRPLFGFAIDDRKLLGNKPGRLVPGGAHSRYFSYPDDQDPEGVAKVVQSVLRLDREEKDLSALVGIPRASAPA